MWPNSAIRLIKPFLVLLGAFSQARMVEIQNGFLRCVQHLELQVLSTHMPYFEEIFFLASNSASMIFKTKIPQTKRVFYGKKCYICFKYIKIQ